MRGVTFQKRIQLARLAISTHTPHARRDTKSLPSCWDCKGFQLTRLMRGVTLIRLVRLLLRTISTHTPHARRDVGELYYFFHSKYFNSHASCEA